MGSRIISSKQLVDILLVNETRNNRYYFTIPHYVTYHTNNPDNTAQADTVVIINNTIWNKSLTSYGHISYDYETYDINIAWVYCPSWHNIKKENFDDFFETLGPKLYLMRFTMHYYER